MRLTVLKEFKEFAMKGNVMDLAVGVIIGAAFGKIVTSMVDDVIMPLLSPLTGKVNFVNMYAIIGEKAGTTYASLEEARKAGATTIAYGAFIQNIVQFLIVAFAVFLMVKALNKMKRVEEAPVVPTEPPADVALLTEIRDLLKKG